MKKNKIIVRLELNKEILSKFESNNNNLNRWSFPHALEQSGKYCSPGPGGQTATGTQTVNKTATTGSANC